MQLRPVARRPAGLALKPLKPVAAKATVPNRGSYGLRPLLRRRCSCPAAPRTKARDEAEREPQAAPPAKEGEAEAAAAEPRSLAYQIFAALYVCALVCSWRIGELIVVNAEEALERLRRYVRDNFFNQKR